MSVEADEAILIEENQDLAAVLVGGIWLDFKQSIPDTQAKVLVEGFNLIVLNDPSKYTSEEQYNTLDKLSEGEAEEVLRPDLATSILPDLITSILLDESKEISSKKIEIYNLITNNIIDGLVQLGFVLNEDEVNIERLPELIRIGNFFYDLEEYEDLIGMTDLLSSYDIPPSTRFIQLMQTYLGDNEDLSVYELLIEDVSEVTLTAIKNGLSKPDEEEEIPAPLLDRIRANYELLEGTVVKEHLLVGGQVGSTVSNYLSFFSSIAKLLDNPTDDNVIQYVKEVVGVFVISEVNDGRLKETLYKHLNGVLEDAHQLSRAEDHINKLVLSNG